MVDKCIDKKMPQINNIYIKHRHNNFICLESILFRQYFVESSLNLISIILILHNDVSNSLKPNPININYRLFFNLLLSSVSSFFNKYYFKSEFRLSVVEIVIYCCGSSSQEFDDFFKTYD